MHGYPRGVAPVRVDARHSCASTLSQVAQLVYSQSVMSRIGPQISMILRLLCWTVAAMAQSTASFSDADVAPEAQVKPKEPASSSSSKPQSLVVQTSSDEVLCQRGDTGACLRLRELRLELSCRQGNGQACYQLLDSECRRGRLPACTQLAAYSDVHSPNASEPRCSKARTNCAEAAVSH